MDSKKFIKLCIDEVVKYTNEHLDKTDKKQITKDDVFVVWSCKTLQNNKALLSTNIFDAYKKWENRCIKLGGYYGIKRYN